MKPGMGAVWYHQNPRACRNRRGDHTQGARTPQALSVYTWSLPPASQREVIYVRHRLSLAL